MRILIIGGSHAGIAAARHLRKINKEVEIILIEKADVLGYVGSSLNLYLEKEIDYLEDGFTATIDELLAEKIQVHLKSTVTSINAQKKVVHYFSKVHDQKKEVSLAYDFLILAMGSSQYNSEFSIEATEQITHYKTLEQAEKAVQTLENAETVVIIGAGLIGLEMAETLSRLKKEVYLIDRMDSLLFRYFDHEISSLLAQNFPTNVHLLLNNEIRDIQTDEEKKNVGVRLANGKLLVADAILYAINPRPTIDLIEDQLTINMDGTISTNEFLQTSDPDIYAAGDLVAVSFNHTDETLYIPLVTNAYRTGIIAATNILLGNTIAFPGSQRTIVSQLFNYYLASTGINEEEAPYFDLQTASVTNTYTKSRLFGEEQDNFSLTIKIVYDPKTKKLIGGQLLTPDEKTVEIINILSALVAKETTLNQLATMDFFFNPKLSLPIHFLNDLAMTGILQEE
ncbi:MAG TPA: FAD-dependent oxidoreductase [Candidatus Tetragenococcus pullicola]|nr:FAD-dependent oxidoreductase [Candidatus Tetragenococcus pullicola]